MRLGLLQDPAVIDRQVKREQEELEKKRNPKHEVTVKTKEEVEAEEQEKEAIRKRLKNTRRRVKPLSENKAIDTGATFISEGFLFLVAGGLIVWESFRSSRKERKGKDEVQQRLERLEGEMHGLRAENQTLKQDIDTYRRISAEAGVMKKPAPAAEPAKEGKGSEASARHVTYISTAQQTQNPKAQ